MDINQMTATYSKGDAIGNYVRTLDRLFREQGYHTAIFSDNTMNNRHSSKYRPTGNNILWFHYSIYSDNLKYLLGSNDIKIMDFHGVSPANLFRSYNAELEQLCRKGNDMLEQYAEHVDLCIVHSEFSRKILEENGYKNIIKLPLVVDFHRLETIKEDGELTTLLSKISYILFVGRIVPQKSIIDILKVYSNLKRFQPDLKLFLVGDYNFSADYMKEIMRTIRNLDVFDDIVLTGRLDDAALVTFYKHASLFMMLSEWETFCVPLIEAMYYQVPIIGINKTAIPETIGDAGVIFDEMNHIEIAEKINAILSDTEQYDALKLKCTERIQYFTDSRLKSELVPILKNIKGNK